MHSKEAPHRPVTRNGPNPSRQLLAAQAKIEIPATKFVVPVPNLVNGRGQQNGKAADHPGTPYGDIPQGDMFDTDVEGVDDSTVAGTTILDPEETPQRFQLPLSRNTQQRDIDTRRLHHIRPGSRLYGSNWYENLGDKAMKTAGFDSDDADDDASQLTSSLAEDDDKVSETTDLYYAHKNRAEEPLSQRLEGFWNASRRSYTKPSNAAHTEPSPPPLATDAKKPSQIPTIAGGRKINIPRSHSGTPRTRFSPPKPSLLDQLDISPTRHPSGQRTQGDGKKNTSSTPRLSNALDGLDIFTSDNERPTSEHSATAFDITNLDSLDDDEDTIQDPFSKRLKRSGVDSTIPRKREFEADYPPEILYQKSFTDLQAEPFDYTPTAAPAPATEPQPQEPSPNPDDKVSFLMHLSDDDRVSYLSNLSIDEWEDCGDQLVEQFTQMLSKMKDLRRARRKTVAVFEAEIERRHELVEAQNSELSSKLDDMRTGGVEVLRGRGRS